jgi:hypothetical protein
VDKRSFRRTLSDRAAFRCCAFIQLTVEIGAAETRERDHTPNCRYASNAFYRTALCAYLLTYEPSIARCRYDKPCASDPAFLCHHHEQRRNMTEDELRLGRCDSRSHSGMRRVVLRAQVVQLHTNEGQSGIARSCWSQRRPTFT